MHKHVQDQARPNLGIERRDAREIPPLAEALVLTDSYWERSVFFKSTEQGKSNSILHYIHICMDTLLIAPPSSVGL